MPMPTSWNTTGRPGSSSDETYTTNWSRPGPSTWRRREKGKFKARDDSHTLDDYGKGGTDGIILPLQMVMTGSYDVAYTIPILVGSNQQNLSLQVDTGSSDLWIASNSCRSSACGATNGHTYDPSVSSASATSTPFDITYLRGEVKGPIVWDTVMLGGYSVDSQALSAANEVDNEPLSSQYSGILGLALPIDSVISELIPATESNAPDGAAFASNLFSITPLSSAPASHFISLSLSRPDSPAYPMSLLGIGKHPSIYVQDPSEVTYVNLVSESTGTHFWKASVRGISVWVNGEEKEVELGNGVNGGAFPTAVLDSGVPLILTTSQIANGIYGALGIGPSSDGMYYLPCTKPINMSVQLSSSPSIPLHPLDLTAVPPATSSTSTCVGLIQVAEDLNTAMNPIGDMVFGVPFLRSTYTVMAYSAPDSKGVINAPTSNNIHPFLGLVSLTDPTQALKDFNTVRVLQQPIPAGSGGGAGSQKVGGGGGGGGGVGRNGKKIGIDVLIGVMSFFALCAVLFAVRWFLARREWMKTNGFSATTNAATGAKGMEGGGAEPVSPTAQAFLDAHPAAGRASAGAGVAAGTAASGGLFARFLHALGRRTSGGRRTGGGGGGSYELARRRGSGGEDDLDLDHDPDSTLNSFRSREASGLSEDEIRKIKFDAYLRRKQGVDHSPDKTFNSSLDGGTLVGGGGGMPTPPLPLLNKTVSRDSAGGVNFKYSSDALAAAGLGAGVGEFGTRRRGQANRFPSYTSDVQVPEDGIASGIAAASPAVGERQHRVSGSGSSGDTVPRLGGGGTREHERGGSVSRPLLSGAAGVVSLGQGQHGRDDSIRTLPRQEEEEEEEREIPLSPPPPHHYQQRHHHQNTLSSNDPMPFNLGSPTSPTLSMYPAARPDSVAIVPVSPPAAQSSPPYRHIPPPPPLLPPHQEAESVSSTTSPGHIPLSDPSSLSTSPSPSESPSPAPPPANVNVNLNPYINTMNAHSTPGSLAPSTISELDTEERAEQSGMAGVGTALRMSVVGDVDEFGYRDREANLAPASGARATNVSVGPGVGVRSFAGIGARGRGLGLGMPVRPGSEYSAMSLGPSPLGQGRGMGGPPIRPGFAAAAGVQRPASYASGGVGAGAEGRGRGAGGAGEENRNPFRRMSGAYPSFR